jgi:hypothetical protein
VETINLNSLNDPFLYDDCGNTSLKGLNPMDFFCNFFNNVADHSCLFQLLYVVSHAEGFKLSACLEELQVICFALIGPKNN